MGRYCFTNGKSKEFKKDKKDERIIVRKKFIDTFVDCNDDYYIFDESFKWCFAKTHEDIEGKRYCLKCEVI